MLRPLAVCAVICLFLNPFNAWAQKDEKTIRPERMPDQEPVVTRHEVTVDGKTIRYTATAGYMVMKDEDGTHKANVFFVAYTKDGEKDPAGRPITFTFNGGPGSSSVWLHLGALGPKRVWANEKGDPPPPPYRLVDNEHSWLDMTDLVFIDPVTTGFSRPAVGEDPKQFHGYREDLESVGEFIRLYASRYERWASPKFLAGESYGTTRASGLSSYLQGRYGLYLNGIVLISSILNFETARFDVGNDLPYMLFLPTYTATAWYHKQLAPDLQQDLNAAIEESKAFAMNEYALALMKGDAIPAAEEKMVVATLSRLTGLSEEYVRQTNLRIVIHRFTKELLRDQRRTVGRLDSRFIGIDRDAASDGYEYDPSYNTAIYGPYTAMLNDYVRRELKVTNDLPYEILTGRVQPWPTSRGSYLNVAEDLRKAMTQNPHLKVFVACGYYDMATPFFAADYTFDHLQLDPSLRMNITKAYYESGHMMYIHQPSLKKLKDDVRGFYSTAVPGK